MKYKKHLLLAASMLFLLSGCTNLSNEGTTTTTNGNATEINQTTEDSSSNDSVKETNSSEEPTTKHNISRSESTIKNDSKTNSIITSQNSFQIGTYVVLSIYADKQVPDRVFDDLFNLIDKYEYMISKSIQGTELNQVNENAGIAPVKVSDDIIEMIKLGIKYADVSKGKFDISVGPLVDLWGIGTDSAHLPTDAEIKEKMALVDYKKIVLNESEHTVFLPEKNMEIDLGAIAKGYIADRLKELIQKEGYESAIINLGGNVLTVGKKPNSDNWNIGVRNPESDAGTEMGILKLTDNSIVSSGVYERFFIKDNVRYHHIINATTGYPEQNNMLSVSIISDRSVDGDSLSTTVFLLGLEEGYKYIESLDGIGAVFIMADHSVYVTSALKDKFTLTSKDYTIKEMP
ncbi:FAD:protein FMN transferase [Fusibacter bizertensis]